MKLWRVPALWIALASFACGQQTATPAPAPGSKVIFSRSTEDPNSAPQADSKPSIDSVKTAAIDKRQSITFLSYDLDVHLQPREQGIAVRARMTLRNDAEEPLHSLQLQLSSTLSWTNIRVEDRPAAFTQRLVDSDSDHTGTLREAAIALAAPLGPGQSIAIDATYEGVIAISAKRLEQLGAPPDAAERSDWDRVSADFVGLRGFGNVVWYPVASVPVALGDGDKLFAEVADQRLRQSEAMVTMRVTEEFFGAPPNLAVLDGELSAVTPASLPTSPSIPGIATCTLTAKRLGFSAPSLFLLTRTRSAGNGIEVFTRPENADNAQAYISAAGNVEPLISWWMGPHPQATLSIIDLAKAGDSPFEDGRVLFTGVDSTPPEKLNETVLHSWTHAYFRSRYPWLDEGAASFMGTLWLERERGRDFAILQMDNMRNALSLAEPDATELAAPGPAANRGPSGSPGEPLLAAKEPVYYRTKATYVFWMLRDLAGDDALARAFRAYKPDRDATGREFEQVLEQASGKDLKWFFDDWVYRDRGLPDLSIDGVYPNQASVPGTYLVAVDIRNSGGAEAAVPVSVRTNSATVTEELRVPANSKITHRFVVQGPPVEVAVNDGSVPEVQASVHRRSLSTQP